MKFFISNIYIWLIAFCLHEIRPLKFVANSFFSNSKSNIENKLSKYKSEISIIIALFYPFNLI